MGARPGEKVHEELVTHGEDLLSTNIDKIGLLHDDHSHPGGEHFEKNLAKLEKHALKRNSDETVRLLWEMIQVDQENAGVKKLKSGKLKAEMGTTNLR